MFIPNMLMLAAFAMFGITMAIYGIVVFKRNWVANTVGAILSALAVGLLIAAVIHPVQ